MVRSGPEYVVLIEMLVEGWPNNCEVIHIPCLESCRNVTCEVRGTEHAEGIYFQSRESGVSGSTYISHRVKTKRGTAIIANEKTSKECDSFVDES